MESNTKRPISMKPFTTNGKRKYRATYESNGSVMTTIFKTQEDANKFLYPDYYKPQK